jgi:hypothetical protein
VKYERPAALNSETAWMGTETTEDIMWIRPLWQIMS